MFKYTMVRRLGRKLGAILLSVSVMGAALVAAPTEAGAYDIDCKIILCLPAGFPGGCRDAYKTFIRRITATPPKPPIGFCAMGSVRDLEMDDDHPERMEVMFSIMDEARMERTLRSVKVEYFHSRHTCCSGRECEDQYPCTSTYFINGDGSNFRQTRIRGHHSGTKVGFTDLDGKSCIAGDSQSWVPPLRKCRQVSRDDEYCWNARPGYWQSNTTCAP